MNIRKNIAVSEEGFIFNPATGDSFSTNAIGAKIVALMKQNQDTQAIALAIHQEYDVDLLLLERDIDEFIATLKDHNLIENGN